MSPVNRYPKLFFDIETEADKEAVEFMAEVDDKVKEETAPLDPDLGRIVAVGWAMGEDEEPKADVLKKGMEEKMMLCLFWERLAQANGRCAGYNIMKFDLPYIMRRSLLIGVRPPLIPNLALYRSEPVTDLMMLLANWDLRKAKKLKWVCRRFGIQLEAEGIDGSMVKTMTLKEKERYVKSDVRGTQELYKKMEGIYFQ